MIDFINSIVVLLNFVIIPGLSYGSQLALGALGVTFVYAILRFANFAHGELMSFGAMITILFTWFFSITKYWFRHSSYSTNCIAIWNFSYYCSWVTLR